MPFVRHVFSLTCALLLICGSFTMIIGAESPRTAESSTTPNNRNPERHEKFLERIKQGPVDLLFLGDSITDYWPNESPETWSKWAPYNTANFGITAERTEDVLWRITNGELDGIAPKVVVLMIGTNNVGQVKEEKPEWAAAGVKKILDVIREKLPKSKILLLSIFPRGATKDHPVRKKVGEINDIIKNYGDGENIIYLDIVNKFLDEAGNLSKDIFPDLLHPNGKGYQIWVDAMWPTLEPMLK